MQSIYAIYRKELGHYFVSPVAYVVTGLFLFLTGLFFTLYLQDALQASMQAMEGMMPQSYDAATQILRATLGLVALLMLFILPMLTMGVFAEEKKRGTMELLMTSPITEIDIVLGKFLASLTLLAAMLLPTAIYLVFVFRHTTPAPPLKILLAGYLGVLLFGGSLLSLGSFLSSLTENQLIAGAFTFAAFLVLWALDFGERATGSTLAQVLAYLSVINHYEDFTRGIIDTSGVIYYASFILLFLFL